MQATDQPLHAPKYPTPYCNSSLTYIQRIQHWHTLQQCLVHLAPVECILQHDTTERRPVLQTHTHTHTHTRLTALFPGLPGWAGTRKVKLIWILLEQETVSGSGISWAICKSAPRSRQITMPAPHLSDFYRPDALPATQPTAWKHWRRNHYNINNVYFPLQFLRFQFSEDFVNKIKVYFLYYFILTLWRPHPQMHETVAEYAVCDWTVFTQLPKASLTSLTLCINCTCRRFQGLRWFSMIFISQ